MAYYYIAQNWDIYKTVGSRYVKKIYTHNRVNLNKMFKLGDGMPKITIPLIRRVFPQLIAQDIVGIQPMTGTEEGVFFTHWSSLRRGKFARHEIGFKRKRRNRYYHTKRNIIRIELFRAQIKTRFETNDFNLVIFEMSMHNL